MKVGDKVVFWEYDMEIGTVTRIGQTTASIKEEGIVGFQVERKRVRLSHVFPASPENVVRVERIKALKKKLEEFDSPLRDEISRLRNQISATCEYQP